MTDPRWGRSSETAGRMLNTGAGASGGVHSLTGDRVPLSAVSPDSYTCIEKQSVTGLR